MGPHPGVQYAQMIRERFNTTHRPVTRPRESAPFVAVPDSLDVAKVSGESVELRLGVAHEAMPPSSCLARQASHASPWVLAIFLDGIDEVDQLDLTPRRGSRRIR